MLKITLLSLLFVTFSAFAETPTFKCHVTDIIIPVSADDLAKQGMSGGSANIENGYATIKYDKDFTDSPEVMNHVIAHECAHHMLGHSAHTPRNYYAQGTPLNENPADCLASKMLVNQLGYGEKEFEVIGSFLGDKARARLVKGCAK